MENPKSEGLKTREGCREGPNAILCEALGGKSELDDNLQGAKAAHLSYCAGSGEAGRTNLSRNGNQSLYDQTRG